MSNLDKVKLLVNVDLADTSKDNLLELLLQQAQNEFLQYTNRETMPENGDNVVIDMAIVKYNLLGAEGLQSQSYSGMSETYENYSPQLIKALNRYRKIKML